MTSRFGKFQRAILVGSLVLSGAAVVSVVGAALPATPAAAATPSAWTAYVVCNTNDTVIPVNTASHAVGAPIAVGSGPSAIAITPNAATAYVTDEGTTNTAPGFVTPIDLSTNTPGGAIPVGSGPDAIAITPDGSTAYVGSYNTQTVTPINLVTDTAGTPIPMGASPVAITITPDGSTAYVTLAFDPYEVPIKIATNTIGTSLLNTSNGYSSAITPDGTTLFTTSSTTNGVATLDTTTQARGSIAASMLPEGVAVTPDGSTAYVAYETAPGKASLLPIPTANPSSTGTPIALGTGSAEGVAITPDGSAAFVTDPSGGTVVPVALASGTAQAPVSLGSQGTNPIAIAITPDQAPMAHVHESVVTTGTVTFDASASTVAYGTIASYNWNFGDGTSAITTTPTVTHTYTGLANQTVASVTETSSTGTSTTDVYTGQTASRSGGPQATAALSVAFYAFQLIDYPSVTAVTPDIGSTNGPTTVSITVSMSRPPISNIGVTVDVGGVAATNVTISSWNLATAIATISATLPAQPTGVDDVIVTVANAGSPAIFYGSSAVTPADQFTYSASTPVVTASCSTSNCLLPAVQYGSTSLSSTVSSGCTNCSYTASLALGVPATGTSSGSCPNGMSYAQAQAMVNEAQSGASSGTALSVALIDTVQGPAYPSMTVCVDITAAPLGASAQSQMSDQAASLSVPLGQDVLVKKCAKKPVAPCVQQVVASGTSVTTKVLLPVNETNVLTVGPKQDTIKKLLPKKGAPPGSSLKITGTNLNQVSAVYIDGSLAGGRLIGGLPASIVSETAKSLVVTVPPGASTGPVTLIGWSGAVTSSSVFPVT